MGWFDAFRDDGLNTYYGTKRSSVIFDKTLVYIIFFTIVLSTALTILVIGSRGRERWTTLLRVVLSLHSGVIILVTLTGLDWQTASITSMCSYTASYKADLEATIGVHIGLKNVNITLKGYVNGSKYGGSVNYNERYAIDKVTDMESEYQNALNRGLPWPIMSVLEYLSINSGGLHWMINFHESGHFTYMIMWCALVMWFMAVVLMNFVILRGALLWTLAGVTMVMANVIYHAIQPGTALQIQFKDGLMKFHYGWCFWLNLISGLITLLSGLTVFIVYHVYPDKTSLLFLLDTTHLQQEPVEIPSSGTLDIDTPMSRKRKLMSISPGSPNPAYNEEDDETLDLVNPQEYFSRPGRNRRTMAFHTGELSFDESTGELTKDDGGGEASPRTSINNNTTQVPNFPPTISEEETVIVDINIDQGIISKKNSNVSFASDSDRSLTHNSDNSDIQTCDKGSSTSKRDSCDSTTVVVEQNSANSDNSIENMDNDVFVLKPNRKLSTVISIA